MFNGSDPIIAAILAAFIQNLKPASRDTTYVPSSVSPYRLSGIELISHHFTSRARVEKFLYNLIDEYCNKENERSVWWNDERRRNFNPLVSTDGFFSLSWDKKVRNDQFIVATR